MTYVENVFLCLSVPLMLSLFFVRGAARRFSVFLIIGMGCCLLSAYVSTFFLGVTGATVSEASIEIAPVCEESMKLLPLLLYYVIFAPEPKRLRSTALALAAGFATFENVCYLAQYGAENFSFLLTRGISAGALHILCGIVCGFGISHMFPRRWLALTGTLGILGFCVGLHAIYNLLITADGLWKTAAYLFPAVGVLVLYAAEQLLRRMRCIQDVLKYIH